MLLPREEYHESCASQEYLGGKKVHTSEEEDNEEEDQEVVQDDDKQDEHGTTETDEQCIAEIREMQSTGNPVIPQDEFAELAQVFLFMVCF